MTAASDWTFAVVGCGSIGKRHIRNLIALGQPRVIGVDPRQDRRDEAAAIGASVAVSLEDAIAQGANVVFITSPNRYHRDSLETAVQADCHIFMEKPLDVVSDGLEQILETMRSKNLVGMMGGNWKFHPSLKRLKHELETGTIGRVLTANMVAGQYLPDWHPWEDYRLGYSARADLGGGVLLDSHELDYATWLLGPAVAVACLAGKLSDLEINTEDSASLMLELHTGIHVSLQLDYTQRLYRRVYAFNGSEGSLIWDAAERNVRRHQVSSGEWTVWDEPRGYDVNTMYLKQTEHFLQALTGEVQPITPLAQGLKVLRLIEAAKRSSLERRFINLETEVNA
jgi:predicted dehydrogenase